MYLSIVFQERSGGFGEFLGKLVEDLSQAMNFTVSEIIWENDHGNWNPGGSNWTGVIGRIHRREADIGIVLHKINLELWDVIHFTTPIAMGNSELHFRTPNAARVVWNAYFKVLINSNKTIWLAVYFIDPVLTIDYALIGVASGRLGCGYLFHSGNAYFANHYQIQKKTTFLFSARGAVSKCLGYLVSAIVTR